MRHEAILNIYPNVKHIKESEEGIWRYFDVNDNNITIEIDESLVIPEMEKLQAEYDAHKYARNRCPLYPATGDELDALYHAGVFPDEMAAKLKKVKDDNPKP